MKNIILIISLFFFSSCISQKPLHMIPQIDNKFEKFDFEKFMSTSNKNPNILREFLSDGTYIELDEGAYGKGYIQTSPNSYFMINKIYYVNGRIKTKGLFFNVSWGGFKKGIWYEFDEQGNLVKETDYDKPYQFDFDDILAFCKKEGIPVDKGPILQSTGYHTIIKRNEDVEKSGAVWEIRWLKKPDKEETIKLDGVTGKILERREQEFINN